MKKIQCLRKFVSGHFFPISKLRGEVSRPGTFTSYFINLNIHEIAFTKINYTYEQRVENLLIRRDKIICTYGIKIVIGREKL